MKTKWCLLIMSFLLPLFAISQVNQKDTETPEPALVKGVVLESDNKGNFFALQGASIYWLGTTHGTVSDSAGSFKILPSPSTDKLVVSYSGYTSDTLTVDD